MHLLPVFITHGMQQFPCATHRLIILYRVACSRSNGFVPRAASESSYSRSIRPLHSANEPFSALQNNREPGDYRRGHHGSASALAVVPFRESRLPSSSVSYSVDGRLADDMSDATSAYASHIMEPLRDGSVTPNSHAGNFRRYFRSRSVDESKVRDDVSVQAFSDIAHSRSVANDTQLRVTGVWYNPQGDNTSSHDGQWTSQSDVIHPGQFSKDTDNGDS